MKPVISFILLLISACSFCQSKNISFSRIDARADDIDASSPDTLSYLLTSPYTTDLEKVRSIFYWITSNISYNTIRYQPQPVLYEDDGYAAEDDADSVLKPLDERVARITLKRRHSLCDGYARLFKTLCDHAGIKSEVITGYARTNSGSNQFRCNHKWNAVMIDSNWYLLDATWAAGYLNFSGAIFIRNYNDYYFLTPPKAFIRDHYPDDIKWALLDDVPVLQEFNRSPFRQPAFNYKIVSYKPSRGVINAKVGDTIAIVLKTIDSKKNLFLLDKPSVDSSDIAFADSSLKANMTCITKGDKVSAVYIVPNENVQWLQVVYNSNVILRYKLDIKKEPFNYPPIIIKDIVLHN
ncbi:MAG TPA: transglutaminase domain-containing protein [Parafilimonas sp.]|nr:transglutaminase domain-containing protein [Parafilimonas sp.]